MNIRYDTNNHAYFVVSNTNGDYVRHMVVNNMDTASSGHEPIYFYEPPTLKHFDEELFEI